MKNKKHSIAHIEDIGVGEHKLITIDSKSIGLYNIQGEYIAVLNICPHQFAPICKGTLRGTTIPQNAREFKWGLEGQVLACPWHGWEFELPSGRCLTDKRSLKTIPVTIENGYIKIEL